MNSALVIKFGVDDVELARERVVDDRASYWALAEEWIGDNGTTKVTVARYNGQDECVACYVVTPGDMN